MADIDLIADLEATCFPPEQAAPRASFEARLNVFASHILIMELDGAPIGFINGAVIDQPYIEDVMYSDASCHSDAYPYQSVFGIGVLPDYQGKGYGRILLQAYLDHAKEQGRQGVTLTCLEKKLGFYEKLGFRNYGGSDSNHGGAQWFNMLYLF